MCPVESPLTPIGVGWEVWGAGGAGVQPSTYLPLAPQGGCPFSFETGATGARGGCTEFGFVTCLSVL